MGLSVRAFTGALCFAAALSGCSKKQDSSTVSLSLPNWPSKASLSKSASGPEALATVENIAVIRLNISGPGIPAPAIFEWDRHGNQTATPPTSITLEVPRGSDRLIQVLVVFEETDGSNMQFHYGDTVANLGAEFNSVGVTIQPIGGVTGGGSIAGRYLDATGKGPTGPVEIRFQPPNGRPPMVVDSGFIFEGWFNFFALPTNGLTYRHVATNTMLFQNYSTASVTPLGTQQAKVKLSQYWYHKGFDTSGNPIGPRVTSPEQISIVGHFGAGGNGKSVCFENANIEITDAFANGTVGDNSKINWVGNAAGSGSVAAGEAGILAGGTPTCGSEPDKFHTFLKVDHTQVTRREGMLGFRGPFVLQDTGGSSGYLQEILATRGADSVALNWKYLSGVTAASGLGGAAVFYRIGVQSSHGGDADYSEGDGINCENLSQKGFVLWQDVPAGLVATEGTSTITGISDTNWNDGKFQAVVCPFLRTPIHGKRFVPEGGVDYRAYTSSGSTAGPSFDPEAGFDGSVLALAIQSDGKILAGGGFLNFQRLGFNTARSRIARLNSDGTLDTTFDSAFGGPVMAIAPQPDGKILTGGNFIDSGRPRIARLNPDGTLDTSFSSGVGSGFNNAVNTLALQSDGKTLAAGSFTAFNATGRSRIARLNPDGTLDTSFNPGTGFDGIVYSMALQSDGKVLVGGMFTSFNGTSRNYIARLNSDGSLDSSFVPSGSGFNNNVTSIAVQSDDKIIVGGGFTSFNGMPRNRIARLNPDGTLDTTLDPGTGFTTATVTSAVLQSDGKIIVGGGFTSFNGMPRNGIARLNPDGTLDMNFNPGTGFTTTTAVNALALESYNRILVGGGFTFFNGASRKRMTLLNPDGAAAF